MCESQVMRRDEFLENNPEEIQKVLDSEKIGYLGILTEAGFPRVVPLNFAARSDRIYFHGALSGEKHDLLAKSPRVTFSVARQYALIPSYWMAKGHACPATTFYKSVYVEGICNLVENADEKAATLELIMRKYQAGGDTLRLAILTAATLSLLRRLQSS